MRYFFCVLFFLLPNNCIAQIDIPNHIQSLLQHFQPNDTEENLWVQHWTDCLEHPINIHKISPEYLESLGFLSSLQIQAIINFVRNNHPIKHLFELRYIKELHTQDIVLLLPFLSLPTTSPNIQKIKQEFLFRLQQKSPSTETRDPAKIYSYYSYKNHQLQLGIQGEKDPGEALNFQGGFDFYSGFLEWRKRKFQLILGDFHLQLGQGLMLHQGFGNQQRSTPTVKRVSFRLKPYKGTNETLFFRGIALHHQHKKYKYGLFYSQRRRDAKVYESPFLHFKSFDDTGLHRTVTEKAKQNRIQEKNYGAYLRTSKGSFQWGCQVHHQQWQLPLFTENYHSSLYKSYATQASLDIAFTHINHHFFGEIAYDLTHNAYLLAWESFFTDKLSFATIFRYSHPNYFAPYALFYFDNKAGGKGTALKLHYKVNHILQFQLFYDMLYPASSTIESQLHLPEQDFQLQLHYYKKKNISGYIRFRYNSSLSVLQESNTITAAETIRHQWIWHNDKAWGNNLRFRWRFSIQNHQTDANQKITGWLFYQEIKYRPLDTAISFFLRNSQFDTEFPSRMYAYEGHLPLLFHTQLYYGKGERYVFMIQYRMKRLGAFAFRIALNQFSRNSQFHSGMDLGMMYRVKL